MKVLGIVAEYNPFHRGHLYHINASRDVGDAEAVVAVMSGDFVQRGSAAVFDKFTRAEAAVRCGVSLVLELPLPWCVSSAEGFARGAVGLLEACGVVDTLSFGSECGDAALLSQLAEALEELEGSAALKEALEGGASFAAARQQALATRVGEERAALLKDPNNILGVEYIRALRTPMEILTVQRKGSRHDGTGSASELRAVLEAGGDIAAQLPPEVALVYARETARGRGPVLSSNLEAALMSRLRMLPPEAFARLPDAGEGLENLLYRAVREEPTLERAAMRCKSRRYALARIRRMLLGAALGLEKGMNAGLPPYLRVLSADSRGCALLAEMKKKAKLPVISKAGAVRDLDKEGERVFELGSRAHDLWVLGREKQDFHAGDEDFRQSPVILTDDTIKLAE